VVSILIGTNNVGVSGHTILCSCLALSPQTPTVHCVDRIHLRTILQG
jgi:hypothetical protein